MDIPQYSPSHKMSTHLQQQPSPLLGIWRLAKVAAFFSTCHPAPRFLSLSPSHKPHASFSLGIRACCGPSIGLAIIKHPCPIPFAVAPTAEAHLQAPMS